MPYKSIREWTAWEAESLRLSAFPIPSTTVSGYENWFAKVTGTPPESVTTNQATGQYQTTGVIKSSEGDYRCGLSVAPDRMDWFLGPNISQTSFDLSKFTLGPVGKPWEVLKKIAASWLNEFSPSLTRLAFGAVLVMRVADRESGYRLLGEYLPNIKLDPEGSSDFFYSINRPRESNLGIAGLEINRLSNWSVGHISPIQLIFSSPGMTQVSGVPSSLSINICRLEFDINTKPGAQLPQDRLSDIFTELSDFGKEIALAGDQK